MSSANSNLFLSSQIEFVPKDWAMNVYGLSKNKKFKVFSSLSTSNERTYIFENFDQSLQYDGIGLDHDKHTVPIKDIRNHKAYP